LRETVVPTLGPSIMDDDVLVLLVSALAQTSSQAVNLASILRVREHAEKTDPVVPGLLRARRERSRCRASEQRDEIAATDVDCHVTLPWKVISVGTISRFERAVCDYFTLGSDAQNIERLRALH
jgi:hypothetical protein